jgi:hypothetical protein
MPFCVHKTNKWMQFRYLINEIGETQKIFLVLSKML